MEYAISKFGRIDVLVNNAGIMPASFLVKNCTDEWGRIIDINIKGINNVEEMHIEEYQFIKL